MGQQESGPNTKSQKWPAIRLFDIFFGAFIVVSTKTIFFDKKNNFFYQNKILTKKN